MEMNICFFCSSSQKLDPYYYSLAKSFAEKIAKKSWTLVNGGSNLGLMKFLTKTVVKNNGKTIGIIPQIFAQKGYACFDNTELIITSDMQERKKKLIEISDAFVVLPGGFGTLDELSEIICLKTIGILDKAIVIFNENNFYSNLIAHFDTILQNKFNIPQDRDIYFVSTSIEQTVRYIEEYANAQRK
jgi:hypothetical protein